MQVDYEPLPIVADAATALTDEVLLHPEAGTNVSFDSRVEVPTDFFAGCDVLVEVRLVRLVALDDCGVIVNPVLVEGQVHGGIAAGVAQALYEEVRYDADANPLATNLADYACISATELPSFGLVEMVTPTDANPIGAKGVGESGTTGSVPAVQNAVIDALAHPGDHVGR